MAKFNFSKTFNTQKVFNIDTTNFEYISLEKLLHGAKDDDGVPVDVFTVRGIYINNKGLFGASPVLALDDIYVNLPSHLTETCCEMLANPQAVAEINAGHLGFKIEKYYKERYQKDCYSVEWVDL